MIVGMVVCFLPSPRGKPPFPHKINSGRELVIGKRISEEAKLAIRQLHEHGVSGKRIAFQTGVSQSRVSVLIKTNFASTCKYVCSNCGEPTNSERKLCNASDCRKIYAREHQKENHQFYSYGLTPEARYALLIVQNYQCPVCHCELTEENMHTDHDHETGKVRGITCRKHNNGMGFFDDDPALLRAAADYIEGKTLVSETTNYLAEVST